MNRKSGILNRKTLHLKDVQSSWFRVQGCKKNIGRFFKRFFGSHHEQSSSGFTSIELIMVIICLAILTATIIVKNPFRSQDYAVIAADQLIADIQYVQMRAMGIGSQQNILFSTGTSSYSIREGINVVEQKNLPDNVTIRSTTNLSGNVLTFNTLGEPTFGSSGSASIDIGKDTSPNKTIAVLAITGKVQ